MDPQLQEIIDRLTAAEKSLADKDTQIAALKDSLQASNQELQEALNKADMTDKVSILTKSVSGLQKENAMLKTTMQLLGNGAEQTPPEPPKIPTETFKTDNGEFAFQIPVFFYKGQKVTAEDALLDDEILNHLVDSKSGAIKQVH